MRAAAALLAVLVAAGCRSTVDSLGYNQALTGVAGAAGTVGPGGAGGSGGGVGAAGADAGAAGAPAVETLHPVTGPSSYPNPLKDVLGLSNAQISMKITAVYNQLFHGDATTQAIFYLDPNDSSQAFIQDVLHNGQRRTEGQGLAMMIAVQLNQKGDFDSLWRYAKNEMQVMTGPTAGYFNSYCDSADQMSSTPCLDPFGLEQFVTSLIFAHHRWGSTGAIDYQTDALALFHTIRHQTDDVADAGATTVTNLLDPTTALPYAFPDTMYAGQTRPSIVMPAYYGVWAQAVLDPTFTTAKTNGRTLLNASANMSTGLTPIRATFNGSPVSGWAVFDPECYRTQINMVIDQFWSAGSAFNGELNRLLAFFTKQGPNTYGTSYSLDGTVMNPAHESSLVVANAVAAGVSTNSDRAQYLNALWTMPVTTGSSRYFAGIMQLWALLILGGQFQII